MNAFPPTPAQQEAIATLDRNVMVLASAGTGKTHVLIQRFLYLLEQRPQWPLASIIAITFTKKAAQEMRVRLRAGIRDKVQHSGAAVGWCRRQDELDHLQVSTVHSLCETILREHALEAGLDPDFRVLDELEASQLEAQALDATCQELEAKGGSCLALLEHCHYTLQDFRATLQTMLQQRSTLQTMLDGQDTLDMEQWQANCLDLIHTERQTVWDQYWQQHPELAAAMTWLESDPWWPPGDKMGEKVQPARSAVRALRNRHWGEAIAFLGTGGLGTMDGGAKTKWGSPEKLDEAKSHIKAVNETLKFLQKRSFHVQDVLDVREEPALALWLEARALAEKHYQALKQEQAALDYDDLQLLARDLLVQAQQPAGGRLARWRERINHVLVDEYQDINPLQQQIINCLAPRKVPGKLFVVGDTKQSIYRFREAQVTEFADLAASLRRLTGKPEIWLHRSFRSHKAMVAATNHLFEYTLQPLNGTAYTRSEAKPMALQSELLAPCPDPCVELHIVRSATTSDSPSATPKLYEAQVLVQRIGQLHVAGRPVRDGDGGTRSLELDDVVILMRSLGDLALYEYVLRQAQMPYQVVTGTALKYQAHVRSLLALLQHLRQPDDDFNLAVALRSTLFGLSDETLYQLVQETGRQFQPLAYFPHLPAALTDQPDRVQQAGDILAALYDQVHVLPPDRLIQRILDATDYAATCMADPVRYRGNRQLEDIQALRHYARQQQDLGLGEFLDRFEAIEVKRVRNEDENPRVSARETDEPAVRIMTVHGAKGLEFPVVCVPQLDRSRFRGADSMVTFDPASGLVCQLRDERGQIQKPLSYEALQRRNRYMEQAESKRVLYVACTRAADLLVMTGRLGEKMPSPSPDTNFSPNWLADVLAAFDLGLNDFVPSARAYKIKSYDEFQLACFGYAADQPLVQAAPREGVSAPGTPLTAIPVLSRMPEQAPAPAWPQVPTAAMQRGTLMHNLLDPWDVWMAMSPADLHLYAVQKARQLNIWSEAIPQELVSILLALRQTEEAHAISRAQTRVSEMPVLATWAGCTRLLRLDLVYQDPQGGWHMVDWKTERLDRKGALAQSKQRHLPALAAYARAFQVHTGHYPHTRLCFLAPSAIRWVPVALDELLAVELAAELELEPDI